MSLSYGKRPYAKRAYGDRAAAPAKRTENVRVKFIGKPTLEQLSLAFQTFIAALQEMNVHSLQDCAFYFASLNNKSERIELFDENGEVLETFEIAVPEAETVKSNGGLKRLVFPGGCPAMTDEKKSNG